MKGRSALATMFGFLLLAHTGAAWAQDEEESSEESTEEATDEAAEGAEEATEGAEEAAEEATEGEGDAAAVGRWPRAVIARPLTLPKGLAQVGAAIKANNDFSTIGLLLNAGYGVSDDIEVRLNYLFTLKEFEAKGLLNFGAGYKVLRGAAGGKLEVIARADTGYNLFLEGLAPLALGAQVQYNISDKLAVLSPGGQLSIALEETAGIRPMALVLPVGVGYQVTPEAYVQVDTTIASIELADSPTTVIFSDTTPVSFTAIYNAKPNIDAFATISTDLSNEPGDALTFLVGANYFLGAL
jgi:hypothetical protein